MSSRLEIFARTRRGSEGNWIIIPGVISVPRLPSLSPLLSAYPIAGGRLPPSAFTPIDVCQRFLDLSSSSAYHDDVIARQSVVLTKPFPLA